MIWGECPTCGGLNIYGANTCDMCSSTISNAWWDHNRALTIEALPSEVERVNQELFVPRGFTPPDGGPDDVRDVGPGFGIARHYDILEALEDQYGDADAITVCCSRHYADCDCKEMIDFSAASEMLPSMSNAYSLVSSCETCARYGTPWCAPLMEFLVDYVDGKESLTVMECDDYITVPKLFDEWAADNHDTN